MSSNPNPCPKCDVVNKGCQFVECPLKDEHYQKAMAFINDTPYNELIGKAADYSLEAGLTAMRAIGLGGNVKIILARLKAGSLENTTIEEIMGREVSDIEKEALGLDV
jgi:hypothetical protein